MPNVHHALKEAQRQATILAWSGVRDALNKAPRNGGFSASLRSLASAAAVGYAAFNGDLQSAEAATPKWGPEVTYGGETMDLRRLPPGRVMISKNKMALDKTRRVVEGSEPEVGSFLLSHITCPAAETNTLTQIKFLSYVTPTSTGNPALFVYATPDDAARAPYQPLLSTYLREDLYSKVTFSYQPVKDVYPELVADPVVAGKIFGVHVCTVDVEPGLIKTQADGSITVRVIYVNDTLANPIPTYLLGMTGADAPDVKTYISRRFEQPDGTSIRLSLPVAESPVPNWLTDVRTVAMSFTVRKYEGDEVVVTEPPPPPRPTIYRSDAEGAPDGQGGFVALSLISDGHPVWTAERTGSAVDGAWVRKPDTSYSAPAGEPLRIVKPIAATPSFFRLVR